MIARTTACLRFVLLMTSSLPLIGQTDSSHQHVDQLPMIIDGSSTPDLIPDELAYRHFLVVLAERRDASGEALVRRESRLRPISLSTLDHDNVVKALAGLREQLDDIATRRNRVNREDYATFDSLRSEELSLLETRRALVISTLSVGGKDQLDKYVKEHVKPCIKVYGR